ncbi:MAG: hypothetical protein ACFFD8_01385 [Candidatus Thorarchaeota archaeon]
MPSKRSSIIIGIWAVFAVLIILDYALFSNLFLDSIFLGLNGLMNIAILAFSPLILASLLLDRRSSLSVEQTTTRRPPRGARSVSGEPVARTRPKPRIRRDKRAEQLETIVVEPGETGKPPIRTTASPNLVSTNSEANTSQNSTSSSRFLRSHRADTQEGEATDQQVKDQLDAIEQEMAKLEEQLKQNGITDVPSNGDSENGQDSVHALPSSELVQSKPQSNLSSEELSSELQAIDELLSRLEQRKRAGGVDESTYQRLREKYLKRRAELG